MQRKAAEWKMAFSYAFKLQKETWSNKKAWASTIIFIPTLVVSVQTSYITKTFLFT